MFTDFTNALLRIEPQDQILNDTYTYEIVQSVENQSFNPDTGTVTISYTTKDNRYIDRIITVNSRTVIPNINSKFPTITADCITCGKRETVTFICIDDIMVLLKMISHNIKFSTPEEFNALLDIYKNHNEANASVMVLMKTIHSKNILQYCDICGYREPKIE